MKKIQLTFLQELVFNMKTGYGYLFRINCNELGVENFSSLVESRIRKAIEKELRLMEKEGFKLKDISEK